MDQWTAWVADALENPTAIPIIVIIAVILGAVPYNTSERLMIAKHRGFWRVGLQALAMYAVLQTCTVWFATMYPAQARDYFPPLMLVAGSALVMILALWTVYGISKHKAPATLTVTIHIAALIPVYVIASYDYSELLTSGGSRLIDYVISIPVFAALLFVLLLLTYMNHGVTVRSCGKADAEEIRLRELKLLFTLDKHRQILRDLGAPDTYYIHDIYADSYYRYAIDHPPIHPRQQSRRQRPISPKPAHAHEEAAASAEMPPRKLRRRL